MIETHKGKPLNGTPLRLSLRKECAVRGESVSRAQDHHFSTHTYSSVSTSNRRQFDACLYIYRFKAIGMSASLRNVPGRLRFRVARTEKSPPSPIDRTARDSSYFCSCSFVLFVHTFCSLSEYSCLFLHVFAWWYLHATENCKYMYFFFFFSFFSYHSRIVWPFAVLIRATTLQGILTWIFIFQSPIQAPVPTAISDRHIAKKLSAIRTAWTVAIAQLRESAPVHRDSKDLIAKEVIQRYYLLRISVWQRLNRREPIENII